MSSESESKKSSQRQLAMAIACGFSIAAWARANEVPRSTAFRWAKGPKFRKAVLSYRRRVIDQAVGKLTRHSTEAADTITRLTETGDTQAMRLRAARANLAEMIKVSTFSGLEQRITELEETLDQRNALAAGGNVWNRAPAN